MQRAVKIRHYVDVMTSLGYTPEEVLTGSRIRPEDLQDIACIVEVDQCKRVVANMIRLTGNPAIGFEMGSRLRMNDLGILAHAMIASRTLQDAIELWGRFATTLAGMLIQLERPEPSRDEWSFRITETVPLGFLYNFCVEEILMIMVKFGIALTGQPLPMRRVTLSYARPIHEADYQERLGCAIEFNAETTCVSFAAFDLHQPLCTNDQELHEVCEARCRQIMREIALDGPLTTRLRQVLLQAPPPLPTQEEAARTLGMSTRNLHRQLQKEGSSYRELVAQLRMSLAKEYLDAGQFKPKEVSYLLGFRDVNAFRRTFKQWTGQTVGLYLAAQRSRDR